MNKPFDGLKVVELAGVLAGPAAGMFFAELGAQVVKIENKLTEGDAIRRWKLPAEANSTRISSYYQSVNWGKEIKFLDFNDPDDLIVLHGYLNEADIALVNFKGEDAKKWHLDNTQLRLAYPDLIIGDIKGFKSSHRVAYDAVLQAETGFMSINGTDASGPLKMPVAFIDLFAGHQLKEGLLIALLQRSKTGKGGLVTVTLEESAIASLANQASAWLNTGELPVRNGSLHPVIAPYGETFKTADNRYIVLAVGTDLQFKKLCKMLDVPAILEDDRYLTNAQRVRNRASLATDLAAAFAVYTSEMLMDKLDAAGVPAGIVNDMEQLFRSAVAKNMILVQDEAGSFESKRVKTAVFSIEMNL